MIQNQLRTALEGEKTPKLLLACSGGVDSMVLLHLLEKTTYTFAVAHCNFNLRGEASNADASFVKAYCDSKRITHFVTAFNTKDFAATHGVSTQMAARELRYQWFEKVKHKNGFTHLITAHHRDDQMETFLINLSRGSGIKGLTGIPTQSVLRPLLGVSKEDILAYAKENTIAWREDASNATDDYLRNQLRHQVIPRWKEIQPELVQQFEKSRQQLAWAEEALSVQCEEFKANSFVVKAHCIEISVSALQSLRPLEYYLHALFSPYGFFNFPDLFALLTAQSGKQLVSNTHRLLKDRTKLLLSKKEEVQAIKHFEWHPSINLQHPIHLRVDGTKGVPQKTALLDQTKLKFPLILRKYQEGDYFYPVGMKGKKKLSKYFKDQKYSLLEKEQQWLLCSANSIVWVIGQRVDARFAATSETENPLRIICD